MASSNTRLWIGRILIGMVLFFNLQCAVVFILQPDRYAPGFELGGAAGAAMVRGMGVLFLMWNVPYGVALAHPAVNRRSLVEAIGMQAIGFIGESAIALTLEPGHEVAVVSVGRFIVFDGVGLVALVLAWGITRTIDVHRQMAVARGTLHNER